MKKKLWLLCLPVMLVSMVLHSQKEPQYTQYMYNIGSFNPAYVGSVESFDLVALYRAQWIDIPGAPRAIRFGMNTPLAGERFGIGFNAINDQLGPSSQTFVDASVSYQVPITNESKLSFGVAAGGSFLNVDFNDGNFQNPGEPILMQNEINDFYFTVGSGLFWYADNWYLGASVPNFLTNGVYNDEVATVVDDKLQLNFIGGYVFELSERSKFKPAFLVNYLENAPVTVNLSANYQFLDSFTVGASYRLDNAFSALAGFQVSNSIFIGYSYDENTNGLSDFSGGSHEAIVKFYPGRISSGGSKRDQKGAPKQIDSPRFF